MQFVFLLICGHLSHFTSSIFYSLPFGWHDNKDACFSNNQSHLVSLRQSERDAKRCTDGRMDFMSLCQRPEKKKKFLLTAYLSFNFFSGVQPTLEWEGNKKKEKKKTVTFCHIYYTISKHPCLRFLHEDIINLFVTPWVCVSMDTNLLVMVILVRQAKVVFFQ